eukprot:scaffold1944_cov241-Pinguiococcus_pyrenoidosus.AAC.18
MPLVEWRESFGDPEKSQRVIFACEASQCGTVANLSLTLSQRRSPRSMSAAESEKPVEVPAAEPAAEARAAPAEAAKSGGEAAAATAEEECTATFEPVVQLDEQDVRSGEEEEEVREGQTGGGARGTRSPPGSFCGRFCTRSAANSTCMASPCLTRAPETTHG